MEIFSPTSRYSCCCLWFVAILCFGAVGVILYTRSQTLMLSNAWVYEDLRKLGASNRYLKKTAQGQIKRVFFSPILIGTVLMLGFYTLILLANGGDMVLDQNERMSLSVCLLVVAAMSAVFYGFYRFTLNKFVAYSALVRMMIKSKSSIRGIILLYFPFTFIDYIF